MSPTHIAYAFYVTEGHPAVCRHLVLSFDRRQHSRVLHSGLHNKMLGALLISSVCATFPVHVTLLVLVALIILDDEYKQISHHAVFSFAL